MKLAPDKTDQCLLGYCRRLAGDPPAPFGLSLRRAAADTGLTTQDVQASLARLTVGGSVVLDRTGHGASSRQYRLADGDVAPLAPLADRLYAMAEAAAGSTGAFGIPQTAAAAELGSTADLIQAAFAELVETERVVRVADGTPKTPTRYALTGSPAAAEAVNPRQRLVKCPVCGRLYRGRPGDGCPGFLGHAIFRTLRRRAS